MSKKNDSLIPFGKYANQPVEVLQSDPDYVAWLTGQPWFQSRYPAIFNVVINKFGENEETPEHNRLQAEFLEEDVRLKTFGVYLDLIYGGLTRESIQEKWQKCQSTESQEYVSNWKRRGSAIRVTNPLFEAGSIDVEFNGWFLDKMSILEIELKPVVSDNYPAILRQMRNNGSTILIFESFTSQVISESKMIHFFRSQKIEVIRFDQIIHFDFSKFSIEMNE